MNFGASAHVSLLGVFSPRSPPAGKRVPTSFLALARAVSWSVPLPSCPFSRYHVTKTPGDNQVGRVMAWARCCSESPEVSPQARSQP